MEDDTTDETKRQKQQINIRVDRDFYTRVVEVANADGRTVSGFIRHAIDQHIKRWERSHENQ